MCEYNMTKRALKLLLLCLHQQITKKKRFHQSRLEKKKKALCTVAGQSSHLMNETNSSEITAQTGTNCFSCTDLIHPSLFTAAVLSDLRS